MQYKIRCTNIFFIFKCLGSRTTSPQGVSLDSISLQNSFSSHGISSLYQGRVDLNPTSRTGRTSPGAGTRISPSLYSNLQLRNSFYTMIPSRDGFSSEDGSNLYPEQRLPESHYGVPRSTPVLTNPPRSSPMDSKDQRYNQNSEYSVPKPILPNFSLDKLDMGNFFIFYYFFIQLRVHCKYLILRDFWLSQNTIEWWANIF